MPFGKKKAAGTRLSEVEENENDALRSYESPKRFGATAYTTLTLVFSAIWRFWEAQTPAERKQPPSNQFIELVLTRNWLPLIEFPNPDPILHTQYEAMVDIVRKRFATRLKKIRKYGNPEKAQTDMDEIILCLEDVPTLIDWDRFDPPEGSPLVPGSQKSTRSSQKSWIEEEIPFPSFFPNLKPFLEYSTDYQRKKSNELYKLFLEKCEEWSIKPADLACYFGHRATYQEDKLLARTFRKISQDGFRCLNFPIEQASYLKSILELSRRQWTRLRTCLAGFVRLPTDQELTAFLNRSRPVMEPFGDGWYIPLPAAVKSTLQNLPDRVSQKSIFESFTKLHTDI